MDQYANSKSSNNKSSINNLPTTSSSKYLSLPSITPQQFQQNTSLLPQTLPQSQAQHAALSMHSMYGRPLSAPHTPTSTQPNTPGSNGNGGSQQMISQSTSRQYQLQPNSSYQQPILPYSNNSLGMMPQGSMSMSHQHTQAIAPSPGPTHNRFVPMRPMNPTTPLHAQHPMHQQMQGGIGSPYGQQGPCYEKVPTHVVGRQGRRGILPIAPGHPSVTATGPGPSNNALIPAKDADGKFPCPHCVKTYLHAKHLKRHFLRHTGDRPYMCVLCRDTFSRSDILKRHFQKCSMRRGNPTGASHLSHAQAHLKKNKPAHKNTLPATTDRDMMRNMIVLNGVPTDPGLHPFNLIVDGRMPDNQTNSNDDQLSQGHLSRASSIKRLGSNDGRDRRSMTGPMRSGSSRQALNKFSNGEIPCNMGDIPATMTSMNSQLAAYPVQNGHHGLSNGHNGHQYSHHGPLNGQGGHLYGYGGPPHGQHYEYPGQINGSSVQQQQWATYVDTTGHGRGAGNDIEHRTSGLKVVAQ
ncbi:hypothetical protein ACLOAV_000553 [Pseudogymnoascus australis]